MIELSKKVESGLQSQAQLHKEVRGITSFMERFNTYLKLQKIQPSTMMKTEENDETDEVLTPVFTRNSAWAHLIPQVSF